MENEQLIESIKSRFRQGEKTVQVKEALINEGWSEGDIDAAFSQIRHEALLQIPLFAKVHDFMKSLDHKSSQLSTQRTILIFIGIFLVFVGAVVIMFYVLDPLGIRKADRDQQRENDAIELRTSLEKYYKDNAAYPSSIEQLVPKYTAKTIVDPKSNKPYSYKTIDNNTQYEFCIEFELQTIKCVNTGTTTSIPVAEQVELPEPTAEPVIIYAINGQVFYDTDKDDAKADDEKATEGVAVKILDTTKKTVCETETDASGIFSCSLQGEGQYAVTFALPAGYTMSTGNPVIVILPNDSNTPPTIETLFVGLIK